MPSTLTPNIVYQIVTDKMVAALEAGTAPWQKPWKSGSTPTNLVSGKPYRGVNIFLLQLAAMEAGYSSPYWLTYKQVTELGGHLKQIEGVEKGTGQKTTIIVFWQMVKDRKSKDPAAQIPLLRYYRVFNLDQTEDVRIPKTRPVDAPAEPVVFTPVELAENIIGGYLDNGGPTLRESGHSAWYSAADDLVNLPEQELFVSADEYYATAFHELGHSTGHKDRLDRLVGESYFGSHDYGREELVAEMTGTFLASEAGIETTFDNSAAYLNSWIRTIKEDVKAVVWAAGQAQRAADLILGRNADAEATAGNEPTPVLVEQ